MTGKLTSLFALTLLSMGLCAAPRMAAQDALHQQLLKLIPASLSAGTTVQGQPAFYGPNNLYEYMDGGADIFLLYGVRQMMHLDLQASASDISADVFDMGAPATAFGMYAAERLQGASFVPIGAEGYKSKGALNFFQGQYYVKLVAYDDGADAALEAFGRSIASNIGDLPAPPPLLAQLPSEARKPHSEQYMPNDPLGHSFLGPAYVVAYQVDGQESTLYVTVARDDADARQRLAALKEHFAKTGKWEPSPQVCEGAMRASNSFEGSLLAGAQGRYLFVLINPGTNGSQLLRNAMSALK
jgi:hypothetical protein